MNSFMPNTANFTNIFLNNPRMDFHLYSHSGLDTSMVIFIMK